MALIAGAGSPTATEYIRRRESAICDTKYPSIRQLEAACWRISIAGMLGLTATEFVSDARKALLETEWIPSDLMERTLSENSNASYIESEESLRILSGYISLDEEYVLDTNLHLLSLLLPLQDWGQYPLLHKESYVMPIVRLGVESGITQALDSNLTVQRLCRYHPELIVSLLQFSHDVQMFVETIEPSIDLAPIRDTIIRRFSDVLKASAVVQHNFTNLLPIGYQQEAQHYLDSP